MGKTTLAQSVISDKSIEDHFDLRIWVCVSNSFNVNALTRSMLESATGKKPEAERLAVLQDALRNKLMSSGRILVVLDDIWNDSSVSDWETLLAPLRHGSPKGSKILLTTRMHTVADAAEKSLRGSIVEPSKRFHVAGLPEADYLDLFNWHAFGGAVPDNYRKLQGIGKQVAARLGGSPLAAKVVGSMLNSEMREEYWMNILKNSISKFEEGERGIMSVLRLSYHHLGKDLRPCFAYCSVFPQDHLFNKDELVSMWTAVGLIQQSAVNSREELEDIGRRYFGSLLKRSFFEPHGSHGGEEVYAMHDLLHELAESVSDGECFRFEGDMSVEEIPRSVRHLYFKVDDNYTNLLPALDNWENLRTLHLILPQRTCIEHELWRKALQSLRSIRVLHIVGMGASLDQIKKLNHLRFLSFSHYHFRNLDPFCNYNLHSISFFGDHSSDTVEESMKNLISLRHYKPRYFELSAVRKLTSLHELDFVVDKRRAYGVGELKDLNQLRELKIAKLGDVKSQEEARQAELSEKDHLRRLELDWSYGQEPESKVEELVLDCLQPHSNLKELFIRYYSGIRPANWMEPELIQNLEYIKLEGCWNLGHLPAFGRLPFLKCFYLEGMPAIKQLDCDGGFPQLQVLDMKQLEHWEGLSGLEAWDGSCFPHLCKIVIQHCPELKVLPSLPDSLIELILEDVGLTVLPELIPRGSKNSGSCRTGTSSASSSSLSRISISECPKLTSADGLLQHYHPNLMHLEMKHCEEVVELHIPVQIFAQLECLIIDWCSELIISLPSLLQGAFTHLYKLYLASCSSMTCLPSQEVWQGLTSLKYLAIRGFQELSSLDSLKALGHLNWLMIVECPQLVLAATITAASLDKGKSTFAVDRLSIDDPLLLLTEPLTKLNSVQRLTIWWNRQSESMTEVEPWLLQNCTSLEELYLRDAFSLQSLPTNFRLLSSLKYLYLGSVYRLQSLPQLPLSLERLSIDGTTMTIRERCRKDEGPDWSNIKHIPNYHWPLLRCHYPWHYNQEVQENFWGKCEMAGIGGPCSKRNDKITGTQECVQNSD